MRDVRRALRGSVVATKRENAPAGGSPLVAGSDHQAGSRPTDRLCSDVVGSILLRHQSSLAILCVSSSDNSMLQLCAPVNKMAFTTLLDLST